MNGAPLAVVAMAGVSTGVLQAATVAGLCVVAVARSAQRAALAVPGGRVRRRLVVPVAAAGSGWAPLPALQRMVERLADRVSATLVAADITGEPRALVVRWMAASVVVTLVAVGRWGPAGVLVAGVGSVGGVASVVGWRRGRSGQRYAAALPVVLEACAGRLRAGASLTEALTSGSGDATGSSLLDADLAAFARRVDHGQPFAAAVEEWAGTRTVPGLALVAAALVLGAEAGGARARALDGVAATLRDRRAVAAEVDALSSQARASAVVMMGAPVAFAALGLLSDPEVSAFLLRTPAGLACLGVGLALDALAGVWMLRIARSAA
ncbi:MAG: type II secretion system F family protein [Acidimicrobiales bacterium]|nr:type II secretion system F family protein [Acidimicrobiales bacterium]